MVDVEAVADEVVEYPVALLAEPLEELADRLLAVSGRAQGSQVRDHPGDPPGREGHDADRQRREGRRLRRPPREVAPPLEGGQEHREHRGEQRLLELVLQELASRLFDGLPGIAERPVLER